MAKSPQTLNMLLTDGKRAEVPFAQALAFRGLDADGNLVVITEAGSANQEIEVPAVPLTEAQTLAVKQKWTKLPTGKVADLRAELAAVEVANTPTAEELREADADLSVEDAEKEAKRLLGNARVTAWRKRKMLEAAIDTQAAPMALVRARKAAKDAADKAAAEPRKGPSQEDVDAALTQLQAELSHPAMIAAINADV